MYRIILLSFILSFFSATVFSQDLPGKGAISGTVVDAQTLEPLIGVNILIEKTASGTATDVDGTFKLENLNAGIYNLVIRYIGYESRTLTDIVVGSNRTQQLEITLNPSLIMGEEVRVTAGYFSESGTEGIGKVSFSPEELRRNPGAAQDMGRVLAALPSVATMGETSQDLMVRGGSPTENGNYIDNIPIPNVRHLMVQSGQSNGPLGIINTDLVSDIDFSAGGFSARFGDHLSSVADITYREGNTNRLRGDLGLNMAGFLVNADGPVNENTTFLLSARRSYLDLIADAINAGGAPAFSDAQGKVTHTLNRNNKLTFLNIFATSNFESTLGDAREEGFPEAIRNENIQNTTGVNWRHLWGNGYTNTSLSYSFQQQDQTLTDALSEETSVNFFSDKAMAVLRSVTFLKITPSSNAEFGVEVRAEQNEFDYFITGGVNLSGNQRPDFTRTDNINGSLSAAFFSYTFQPLQRLTVSAGLRSSYTSYNQDVNVAPRFKSRYQLTERLGVNFSGGIFYQTVPRYLLSQNENLRDLRNTRASHLIAGIDYLLTEDTKLTLEVYDKQYRNAPILPTANSIGYRDYVLDAFQTFYDELEDNGEAWARGVELFIQKKLAVDFYGMISASYFRTRFRDFTGVWQDRTFDNRYMFSVIGGYRPNDLWEVSVRWSLLGGAAYTPIDPVSSAQVNTQILDYANFNGARLPAYHSLFTRIDRRFFMKTTNLVTFVEIWNAYNQANVIGDFWNIHTQQVDRATQFSFLPVGGVKFEF